VSLVSVTCPACGASTYVSLPTGHRFVTAEPAGDDPDRPGRETTDTVCDACGETIPVVHAPQR
jgi:rRNA maturation protein Nop10